MSTSSALRSASTEAKLLLIGIPVLVWTLLPIYHLCLFAFSDKSSAFSGNWFPTNPTLRNFQIVFTILTLNFIIPAFSYTFAPQLAMGQFLEINSILGGAEYTFPEAQSRVWRYLAAACVMTLGLCCFLLQLNLRRFYPVLVPLTFMKAYAACCWLVGWLAEPGLRFFLAAAVLDFVTSAAFVFFAVRAHRQIAERDDEELVPRPRAVGL